MGSMAAGAVTGALFKSTGMYSKLHICRAFSHLCSGCVSWYQTCYCRCDSGIGSGRNMELCEKERLMSRQILLMLFTTLILPLPRLSILADL